MAVEGRRSRRIHRVSREFAERGQSAFPVESSISHTMTDETDDAADAASSRRDGQGQQSPEPESDGIGRRDLLIGGGAVGALALGSAGTYLSLSGGPNPGESSFLLQQGYLRYEVTPLSKDEMTVKQFYDYTNTSASPEGDLIDDAAASRLFIYDGPVDPSLVFLHGSPDVDHGGTAKFSFSGLSRDQSEWAVRDDPRSVSDDFETWDRGNQQVTWEWGANTTDGGAFWGVLDREDFTITVNPTVLRGVDSWTFLTGEFGELNRYDLYREKPVKLKPAKGRTVKQANIDVMPDAEHAAFDPYSKESLTVAVKDPPAGVDETEWVGPDDLDPGNYSVNFGSKQYLAGQNAAQPQQYSRENGALYLTYTAKAANFTLESAYGYLVSKTGEKTYVRGRDVVRPGGFDNVDTEPAQLVVSGLHVDPDGPDGENLNDEYVEFENDGDEQLDLTGYTVTDASGTAFDVPDGFTLDANETVRLHTGSGEQSTSDLYWGRNRAVWNNDGDTVVVLDANADTVLEYTYPRQ